MADEKKMVTSAQCAKLIGVIGNRPGPSRGVNGVRGVAPLIAWVAGYPHPHRAAAVEVVVDLLTAEPVKLGQGWEQEATERMAICLDPGSLFAGEGLEISPEDDARTLEHDAKAIQEWASGVDDNFDPEVDVALEGADPEADDDDDGYADFGALHEAVHGDGASLINAEANAEPNGDE